ncbi:MAG: tetratricopeptide repeat protein [Desulfobacterales bacterium]|nr:tetratricopeptide repeat protein [Desulfobacterales bacterium]
MNNPYTVGPPVGGTDKFIGRDDIVRETLNVLADPNQNAIVLYGRRRIGKTSILQELDSRLIRERNYFPVFFSLEFKARSPLTDILSDLARYIVDKAELKDIRTDNLTEDSFRNQFLPRVMESLPQNTSLIFLFDEFDVLDDPGTGQAAYTFFPYLRKLMETEQQQQQFVFVIGREFQDLTSSTLSMFKSARPKRVSLFTSSDTETLVRLSEHTDNPLIWTNASVDRVWDLTHGHPYLTQQLCTVVWEKICQDRANTANMPEVLHKDIDEAVPVALERSKNALEWTWNGLSSPERLVVSIMADAEDEFIAKNKLIELLTHHELQVMMPELEDAFRTLRDWDILERGKKGYRIQVELIRRWLSEEKPPSVLKKDMKNTEPIADQLYVIGQKLLNEGDLESAVNQLKGAVSTNPNHLYARLLLGKSQFDLGEITEAINTLEAAYNYDPGTARPEYLRILRIVTQRKEQPAEVQFQACQAILKINPKDKLILKKLKDLANELGNKAFDEQDYPTALKYFKEAGIDKRVHDLEQLIKHYKIIQQEDQPLEARFQACQAILKITPKDKSTLKKLKDLATELGNNAFNKEDFSTALKYFKEAEIDSRVNEVEEIIKVREVDRELRKVEKYKNKEDWETVIRLYKELSHKYKDLDIWPDLIREGELEILYKEAQKDLNDKRFEQAMQKLDKITIQNKEFKEVQKMIEKASGKGRNPGTNIRNSIILISSIIIMVIGFIYLIGTPPQKDILQLSTLAEHPDRITELGRFDKHSGLVSSLAFSPDGTRLASGSSDNTIRLWDVKNGTLQKTLVNHTDKVWSVAFSPDGALLASGAADNMIRLWDAKNGYDLNIVKGHKDEVRSVAFSPDGQWLASGSNDKTVRLWNIKNLENEISPNTLGGNSGWALSVAFSPDGAYLASGSSDSKIRLWKMKSRKIVHREFKGHTGLVLNVAFSPNGKNLASGSDDGTIRLWKIETGEQMQSLEIDGHWGWSVAFSPYGKILAGTSSDNKIFLWEAESGKLLRTLEDHTGAVRSVAFSPDGIHLASGAEDNVVRLWGLKE